MTRILFRSSPARRQLAVATLVIVTFLVVDAYDWSLYRLAGRGQTAWGDLARIVVLRYLAQIALIAGLVFVGLRILGARHSNVLDALGLARRAGSGLCFALLVCAPLPLVFLGVQGFPDTLPPATNLIRYSILPGVGEEILYRGFLFGLLYRFCAVRFLPAAIFVALSFGFAHIHQGETLSDAAMVGLVTAVGSIWFCWLYTAWGFNLYVPIGFHSFMNGWWEVFSVAQNAAGPVSGLLARGAVIALSVICTLVWRRCRKVSARSSGTSQ